MLGRVKWYGSRSIVSTSTVVRDYPATKGGRCESRKLRTRVPWTFLRCSTNSATSMKPDLKFAPRPCEGLRSSDYSPISSDSREF
jgi:hypothetical protein